MQIIREITVTDAILTATNVAETEYSEWNVSTAYVVGNTVQKTGSGEHYIYECLINNTGIDPATGVDNDPPEWLLISSTNPWRMFRAPVGDVTSNSNTIEVTLEPGERYNAVALLNIDAATINITVTDPTAGEVYNEDYNMVSDSGIQEWYSYFFEPIVRKTALVVTDIPPYKDADLDITITDTGGTPTAGLVVTGLSKTLGQSQHGSSVGIVDYSVKSTDTFGNPIITTRAYSKRADFDIVLESGAVDEVANTLADIRTTPVVWIGSEDYTSSIIYGWYRDFSITISTPTLSNAVIEVEGLT